MLNEAQPMPRQVDIRYDGLTWIFHETMEATTTCMIKTKQLNQFILEAVWKFSFSDLD
jgi:hypothetical protein